MDMVGWWLADGSELKLVTGIDDHSRLCVSAKVVRRATARPVCDALAEAMRTHGVPDQILTDNGKVFTGRFGPSSGRCCLIAFDHDCGEGICGACGVLIDGQAHGPELGTGLRQCALSIVDARSDSESSASELISGLGRSEGSQTLHQQCPTSPWDYAS